MEREEQISGIDVIEGIATSRVFDWKNLPSAYWVSDQVERSHGQMNRVVMRAEDLPMVRVFTLTLEGYIQDKEYAPICRYEVLEFKTGGGKPEQSLSFYTFGASGESGMRVYRDDGGMKSESKLPPKRVNPMDNPQWFDWYGDVSTMPLQIDFWRVRDEFLMNLTKGNFGKPVLFAKKPF